MTMTYDFFDSFDTGTNPADRWTGGASGASIGSGGRGGTNRLVTGSSTLGPGEVNSPTFTGRNIRVVGFAFKLNSASWSFPTLASLRNGTTIHVAVRADPTSGAGSPATINLLRAGSTSIATSPTTVSPGVWHHFAMKYELSTTAGRIRMFINGVEVATGTPVTQNGGTTTIDNVQLTGLGQTQYDDFYFGWSDDTLAADVPGDLRIVRLSPVEAGASTAFTPVPSGPNWQVASQVPGSTETQWVQSKTPGASDLYELSNLPSTAVAIHAVVPYIRARKDDAGARTARVPIRSGGTTYEGAETFTATDGYALYSRFLATDPATTAAWTEAGVNALQSGAKVET